MEYLAQLVLTLDSDLVDRAQHARGLADCQDQVVNIQHDVEPRMLRVLMLTNKALERYLD